MFLVSPRRVRRTDTAGASPHPDRQGIADVLVTCCDGLKGLPDAIRTIWPDTTVQTCVVHMVRNSLRYASKKHWPKITSQMRAIYTAPTVPAAEAAFEEFADDWRGTYPR